MIDRNITEWLFYKSVYKWALDKDEYDDPKWIELFYPNKDIFCKQINESDLNDFIGTLIWIFKEKYPVEFSYLESSMWGLDKEGLPLNDHVNTRKKQDIKPLKVERDDEDAILSVSVEFKSPKINLFTLIEKELNDKRYTKENTDSILYKVEDSPIESIEASYDGFTIYVNQDKIIY
jgi:hypothetical protein